MVSSLLSAERVACPGFFQCRFDEKERQFFRAPTGPRRGETQSTARGRSGRGPHRGILAVCTYALLPSEGTQAPVGWKRCGTWGALFFRGVCEAAGPAFWG